MFTNEPYTNEPYTNEPYTDSPFQMGEDIFEFTNDAVWTTPSIVVTGSPEILWTWSDGTTDDKAIPDVVTCVGTHTLKVTPWDAVTQIVLSNCELVGTFNSMPWINLFKLACNINSLTGIFKSFDWPKIAYLYCNNNSFDGIFNIKPWVLLRSLIARNNNFTALSGSFQTQIKLTDCYFQNCAITSHVQIDKMLSDFVVNAENAARTATCSVNFSGGTNSGPTSAGTANKDILVDTWAWTVTLEPEV